MIRVLIVEDSLFTRRIIRELLSDDETIEIVGEAADSYEALDKLYQLKPDVVCLDIVMKKPDGLWILEKICKHQPTPVIIFSSISEIISKINRDIFNPYVVIDIVEKPEHYNDISRIKKELIAKIKIAASIDKNKLSELKTKRLSDEYSKIPDSFKVIAIGSSAGGPPSLKELLYLLPDTLSAAILIAQHLPDTFINLFCSHIQKVTGFIVKLAEEGDIVMPGCVLVSPTTTTITLHRLKQNCVVRFCTTKHKIKPSIDIMFESVANTYGRDSIGLVLSGMGSDCIEGAKAIKHAGGKVFVQDEKTSLVWGMPKAVIDNNATNKVLSIPEMVEEIVTIIK